MPYAFRILRSSSEIEAFLPEWEQFLATSTLGNTFFNDPYTTFATTKSSSTVSPFIVVVEDDGMIRAIAPFVIHKNRFRLQLSVFQLASFPVRTMMLLGNRVVLTGGDSHDGSLAKIIQLLADHDHEFDLLFLDGIEASERLWRYLQSSQLVRSRFTVIPAGSEADVAFQIELPSSFEEYSQSLGSSTRSSLKRRTKKLLERADGRMLCISQPADVEELLNQVDEIYRDTWQAKTYGHRVRCNENEICRLQYIAERGWLRSYVLLRGETPVAFQLGFQYCDTFHAMDFGFAQAAADCGPGAVLMYLMIRDLFDRDKPKVLDLGLGDSPQKRTFKGKSRNVLSAYVVPRSRSHWFISTQRVLTKIEGNFRSLLTRLKLDNMVRRILKRKNK